MNRLLRLFVFIYITVFIGFSEANAGNIVAADLTYKHVSGLTYEYILTVYSECDVNLNTPPSFQVDYQSLKCEKQGNFIVDLEAGFPKVVSACGNTITKCQGGVGLGFSKAVYKKRFTLASNCDDWVFSWNFCNRSKEITTIVSPESNCLHLESTLNNKDFPSNNSPIFPNDPVAFLTVGGAANIIPGTTEQDGDRLEYSLVAPRDKSDRLLQYKSPYTFTNPIASSPAFSLDAISGEVKLTPTKANERTVFAMMIKEFRNGKLVGSVIRDLQIAVQDGKNSPPTLSGLSNTSRTDTTVVSGKQFCIRLFGSDPETSQRLTITHNNAIPAGIFSSTPSTTPTAQFCWIPRNTDEGEKKIVFTIKDDACPQLSFDREIKITVKKNISVNCNLKVDFSIDTFCIGKKTTFKNLTIPSGNIASWKWDFGNGTSSTTKDPEIKEYYNKPGIYKVSLLVIDNNKCRDSLEKTIRVCDIVKPIIKITSFDKINDTLKISKLCENQKIELKDISTSACTITRSEWYENDKLIGSGKTFNYIAKPGAKKLTLKNYTDGKCLASKDTSVIILNGPRIKSFNSFDFRCSDLDTLVAMTVTGGKPIVQGNPDLAYKYLWTASNDSTTFLPNNKSRTTRIIFPRSLTTDIKLAAVDDNQCGADTTLQIRNPIQISSAISSYCKEKDTISFQVTTSSLNPDKATAFWGVKSVEIDFGDNTSKGTKLEEKHLYAVEGVYNVKIRVEDSSGCVRNDAAKVFNILPDMNFGLSKDSICFFNSSVDYFGPAFPASASDGVINYLWKVGADSLNFKTNSGKIEPSSPLNKFPSIQGFGKISLDITYNGSCQKSFIDSIYVRPLVVLKIDSVQGKCVPFPVQFYTSFLDPNNVANSASWKFFWRSNTGGLVEVDNANELEPNRTFFNHGNHFARINTVDPKGCVNSQSDFLFRVEKIAKPLFDISGFCTNEKLEFAYDRTRDSIGNIFSQLWDFGNGTSATPRKPFFTYEKPGVYKVKLIIFNETGLKGCRDSSEQDVKIFPQPIAAFTHDSACFGLAQKFFDLSRPSSDVGDTIKSNTWVFDNKNGILDTVRAKNTLYQFKNYDSKLTASMITVNSYGCGDTLTKEIFVYPKPIANFSSDFATQDLVPNKPIFFEGRYNPSNPNTSSENVVKWSYKFSRIDSLESDFGNVTFAYPNLDKANVENNKYEIRLITTTKDGCTDTIVKPLDLNAYIIVPNTITPNNDDFGNKFEIISKGIVKVNEYKIYNRWGEVVFDGNNDLNAKWDGNYKTLEQPMGVFVYYISATTIYGEEKILKGNLTLLR